jgi:hypothetical protein
MLILEQEHWSKTLITGLGVGFLWENALPVSKIWSYVAKKNTNLNIIFRVMVMPKI